MAQPVSRSVAWASSPHYLMLIFGAVDLWPSLVAHRTQFCSRPPSHVLWPCPEPVVVSTFVCAGAGELPRELLGADRDTPCRVPSKALVSRFTKNCGALLALAEESCRRAPLTRPGAASLWSGGRQSRTRL